MPMMWTNIFWPLPFVMTHPLSHALAVAMVLRLCSLSRGVPIQAPLVETSTLLRPLFLYNYFLCTFLQVPSDVRNPRPLPDFSLSFSWPGQLPICGMALARPPLSPFTDPPPPLYLVLTLFRASFVRRWRDFFSFFRSPSLNGHLCSILFFFSLSPPSCVPFFQRNLKISLCRRIFYRFLVTISCRVYPKTFRFSLFFSFFFPRPCKRNYCSFLSLPLSRERHRASPLLFFFSSKARSSSFERRTFFFCCSPSLKVAFAFLSSPCRVWMPVCGLYFFLGPFSLSPHRFSGE